MRVDGKTLGGRTLFASLSLLEATARRRGRGRAGARAGAFQRRGHVLQQEDRPVARGLSALSGSAVSWRNRPRRVLFHELLSLVVRTLARRNAVANESFGPTGSRRRSRPRAMWPALCCGRPRTRSFATRFSEKLFEHERVLETANIAGQIAEGFSASAVRFVAEHDIGELKSSHPFDSHPPLADRLEAVGVPLVARDRRIAAGRAGRRRLVPDDRQAPRRSSGSSGTTSKPNSAASTRRPYLIGSCPRPTTNAPSWSRRSPRSLWRVKLVSLALDYQQPPFHELEGTHRISRDHAMCGQRWSATDPLPARRKTEGEAQAQHVRQTSERSPRRHQPLLGPLSKRRGLPGTKAS